MWQSFARHCTHYTAAFYVIHVLYCLVCTAYSLHLMFLTFYILDVVNFFSSIQRIYREREREQAEVTWVRKLLHQPFCIHWPRQKTCRWRYAEPARCISTSSGVGQCICVQAPKTSHNKSSKAGMRLEVLTQMLHAKREWIWVFFYIGFEDSQSDLPHSRR